MVGPHAKRPFCLDPSVKYFVCVGRVFEKEVGIAVECGLIESQPAQRPDGISTGKRPSQPGCRTKRDRATSTTSKWIASGSPLGSWPDHSTQARFLGSGIPENAHLIKH